MLSALFSWHDRACLPHREYSGCFCNMVQQLTTVVDILFKLRPTILCIGRSSTIDYCIYPPSLNPWPEHSSLGSTNFPSIRVPCYARSPLGYPRALQLLFSFRFACMLFSSVAYTPKPRLRSAFLFYEFHVQPFCLQASYLLDFSRG